MGHPNRSKRNPSHGRTPTPAEIVAARRGAEMNQKEASRQIWATENYWTLCEAGEKRMHPAMFELFCIKTKQHHLFNREHEEA